MKESVLQQTMTTAIDLGAYFQRVGYKGERMPTLDTLRTIQLRHAETIAFENLNPLMRWPVPLDIESLQQKLVRDRCGGFCYEHNLLFSHVLKALGFQVTGLAARVPWNEPDTAITPRSHMLLCVGLNEKPYIADVGFGILTHTGPLCLEPDIEQVTPHEPFRLIRAGQEFVMQAKIRGNWKTLPRAEPVCGLVGALVSVNDFSIRPARVLAHDETLETGKYRVRLRQTPHVPHNWEASLLFEEVTRTLLCSDLFTHEGDVEAATESDIVGRAKTWLIEGQKGPFANAYPYTPMTESILHELADLRPTQLALMHGSTFLGDGERALRDLAVTMREVLGPYTERT